MDVEFLRDFLVYSRTLSLSKTAQEVHLSSSAVSRHLAALEREVGLPLFDDRAEGRLSLAGEAVLEAASTVVGACDRMTERVAAIHAGHDRALRVAYLPLDDDAIQAVLRAKQQAAASMPACHVMLVRPARTSLLDMLVEGDADIVISTLTRRLEGDGLVHRLVANSDVYVSLRSELDIPGDSIQLAQLEGMTVFHTLHAPYRDYCEWVLQTFEKCGVSINVRYTTAETTDESLSNESLLDRVLTFTGSARGSRPIPQGDRPPGPERRLYRVTDEGVNGGWYAVWRKEAETPELLKFVRLLCPEG